MFVRVLGWKVVFCFLGSKGDYIFLGELWGCGIKLGMFRGSWVLFRVVLVLEIFGVRISLGSEGSEGSELFSRSLGFDRLYIV